MARAAGRILSGQAQTRPRASLASLQTGNHSAVILTLQNARTLCLLLQAANKWNCGNMNHFPWKTGRANTTKTLVGLIAILYYPWPWPQHFASADHCHDV
jgi:hypothetical protein